LAGKSYHSDDESEDEEEKDPNQQEEEVKEEINPLATEPVGGNTGFSLHSIDNFGHGRRSKLILKAQLIKQTHLSAGNASVSSLSKDSHNGFDFKSPMQYPSMLHPMMYKTE